MHEEGLMKLSELPASHWKTLANLQQIKKRNKPFKPVKSTPDAPFFLPTVKGVDPELFVADENKEEEDFLTNLENRPEFTAKLDELLQRGLEDSTQCKLL